MLWRGLAVRVDCSLHGTNEIVQQWGSAGFCAAAGATEVLVTDNPFLRRRQVGVGNESYLQQRLPLVVLGAGDGRLAIERRNLSYSAEIEVPKVLVLVAVGTDMPALFGAYQSVGVDDPPVTFGVPHGGIQNFDWHCGLNCTVQGPEDGRRGGGQCREGSLHGAGCAECLDSRAQACQSNVLVQGATGAGRAVGLGYSKKASADCVPLNPVRVGFAQAPDPDASAWRAQAEEFANTGVVQAPFPSEKRFELLQAARIGDL